MCISCGCVLSGGSPTDDHDDEHNLTIGDLVAAANAAGVTLDQVAANIAASLAAAPPEPVVKRLAVPDSPKRFVLGVAYPADAVDGHGEFMASAELEQTAWDFCRKHRQIGFYHADGTTSHGEVVESYIHRGDPWVTTAIDGSEQVIKSGDWVLGALFDEIGFHQVVSEAADGWSIDGVMKRRLSPVPRREPHGS